jgi:NAD+ kinase
MVCSKSGGEQTKPSSPNNSEGGHTQNPIPKSVNRIQESTHRKSGVYTPDRYATHYGGPPPLSQRHLVEALVAAEIDNKEGEVGQRDEIRAGPSELRVDGGAHLIPSGRSVISSSQGDSQSPGGRHEHALAELKTPRPKGLGRDGRQSGHSPHRQKKEECKAKAFAFFGQVSNFDLID